MRGPMRGKLLCNNFAWPLLVLLLVILAGIAPSSSLEDDGWVDDDNVDDDGEFPDIKVTDCTVFCDLPVNTLIKRKQLVAKVELPSTFEMYFEYNLQEFTGDWFDEGNFLELTCGGKSTWKMNFQPQFLIKPYYRGKELESKLQILFSQQPAVPLPTLAKKIYRVFNRFSIQFLERAIVLEGIARNQRFEFDVGKMTNFGKCKLWTANDDENFAIGAMIRNVRFRALSNRPTEAPTFRPTGTGKPTPTPTTAMPTNSPLCCDSYSYTDTWKECSNSKDDFTPWDDCEHCNSYQCTDWTIGALRMREREFNYLEESGEDVMFAVGAYGTDPTKAGKCYRLSVEDVPKDIIMQVITTEPENLINKNTVRIQMPNGGLGFDGNACSSYGSRRPQYAVEDDPWGDISIGWKEKDECKLLPDYPMCGKAQEDNLQDLCEWVFDMNLRKPIGPGVPFIGPPINRICEVMCPWQLWQATGYHRSDEMVIPNSTAQTTCMNTTIFSNDVYYGPVNAHYNDTSHLRLQGTMDCGSPEYGHRDVDLDDATFYYGHDRVVSCKRDGYARINAQPTMRPTSIPSEMPTSRPTSIPTSHPTWAPSVSMKPTPKPSMKRPTPVPTEEGFTFKPTLVPKSGGGGLGAPVEPMGDIQVGDHSLPAYAFLAIIIALALCAVWSLWAGYHECKFMGIKRKEMVKRKQQWRNQQDAFEMKKFKEWEDDEDSDYYSSDEDDISGPRQAASTSSDTDKFGELRQGLEKALRPASKDAGNKENASGFFDWNSGSSSNSRPGAQVTSQSMDSMSVEETQVNSPLRKAAV